MCSSDLDPDILTGWEVQMSSWGYLEARGRTHGGWSMSSSCRIIDKSSGFKDFLYPISFLVHRHATVEVRRLEPTHVAMQETFRRLHESHSVPSISCV